MKKRKTNKHKDKEIRSMTLSKITPQLKEKSLKPRLLKCELSK